MIVPFFFLFLIQRNAPETKEIELDSLKVSRTIQMLADIIPVVSRKIHQRTCVP